MSIASSIEDARTTNGEYRAGGTDLQQRLRSGVASLPVVDLQGITELSGIAWDEQGRARIGALTTVATIAGDARLAAAYPALVAAAGALATPQIRAAATVGGNLLQRNRCWYFRSAATSCLKKGGDTCPARGGNHLYGVCFDLGPCVAPHASTLGAALLAYDAEVELADGSTRSIAALYGDGSDGRHDHQLRERELLTAVRMPAPQRDERGQYVRAISRARAEWPLVEVVVRLVVADGVIRYARVTVGGVAPIPMRREQVETALVGSSPNAETFERAASLAVLGANPLPQTGYKVDLLPGTVRDALERAV